MYAQKEVTTFLGIPVDGSKSEMIQKLKEKGFTTNPFNEDGLTGEFNGMDVNVHVVTNNNKVYRIMLADAHNQNAGDIKIRFNKLCQQFQNNKRYISFSDQSLSEEEDIAYEMSVNNKRYEAAYYQLPVITDSIAVANKLRAELLEKYTEEQLANPTEELKKEIMMTTVTKMIDSCSMRLVWFRIGEILGQYCIYMFYDNVYNQASGEDL